MKVVYLSPSTEFSELELNTVEAKHQNNYGTMHSFKDKIELVTSEPVTDYHVFHSENKGKVFLCVKSPQLNTALHAICERLVMCLDQKKRSTISRWIPSRPHRCLRTNSSTSQSMSMGSSTKTPQRTASYRWSLPVSRVIHSCTFNKVALLLTFFVFFFFLKSFFFDYFFFLINSFLYDSFLCYIACNHV